MKKKGRIRKILLLALPAVLILLIGGWWYLCVDIYKENFDKRFTSYEPLLFRAEDFEGLKQTRYQFPSDRGQLLTGYLYTSGEEAKGLLILAHGFGAGHNSYMDAANYFARHGYAVFAYDATGCDESEGASLGGVPQGVIDLEHAISFAEGQEGLAGLPIGLFGHSWGGYSVCSVLSYHPEVKAVIECCGCNSSADLVEAGGKDMAGDLIYAVMPFIRLHELFRYGKYALHTAMDGFAASDAAVMAVHSADDDVLPISYGYDKYYAKYKDDSRFTFVRFEDKGHNDIFNDTSYQEELNEELAAWRETLNYDAALPENKSRFQEDRAEFYRTHLDREKWAHRLDEEMFSQFVSFYDQHLGSKSQVQGNHSY